MMGVLNLQYFLLLDTEMVICLWTIQVLITLSILHLLTDSLFYTMLTLICMYKLAGARVSASHVWSGTSTGAVNAKSKRGKKTFKWWLRFHVQDSRTWGDWHVILKQPASSGYCCSFVYSYHAVVNGELNAWRSQTWHGAEEYLIYITYLCTLLYNCKVYVYYLITGKKSC